MPNPPATSGEVFGEKSVPVMLYTLTSMIIGEVRVMNQVRVSTWLKTNSAPDVVRLFNSKVIFTSGSNLSKPILMSEAHIPNKEVLAMHMLPPAADPLDYDPSEPNRRLMPVTIFFGSFMAAGAVWVSSLVDLAKFIELNREDFTSVYNVQITSPIFTTLPTIKIPMMICRESKVLFASSNPNLEQNS